MIRGALAACALLLAAACASDDVPPERYPRFEPLAKTPRVALVLGSGGPRGFAHIGVLKVLEEQGLKPDLIVGSSVGALVGALYADGYSAAELEKMAYDVNLLKFFEWGMLTRSRATGSAIQEYVNECLHGRTIEQLRIPFAAVVTHMPDKKLMLFTHGDAGLAVRASGADQSQFLPVKIGNQTFIDGDVASPVPIRAARELGAQVVIAVDVSAYLEDTPPGVPEEWVTKDERRAKQIREEAPAADVLLHPNIGYYAGHDESYRHHVIRVAEEYTRSRLDDVRAAFAHHGMRLQPAQAASNARTPSGETSR